MKASYYFSLFASLSDGLLVTVALFMLFARGGCRFGSRRGSACLLACAVLAACGARVNRDQQVHYLYPGDSAYVAAGTVVKKDGATWIEGLSLLGEFVD